MSALIIWIESVRCKFHEATTHILGGKWRRKIGGGGGGGKQGASRSPPSVTRRCGSDGGGKEAWRQTVWRASTRERQVVRESTKSGHSLQLKRPVDTWLNIIRQLYLIQCHSDGPSELEKIISEELLTMNPSFSVTLSVTIVQSFETDGLVLTV